MEGESPTLMNSKEKQINVLNIPFLSLQKIKLEYIKNYLKGRKESVKTNNN